MDNAEPVKFELKPIRKSVAVNCSAEHAFAVFTTRFGAWWPKHQYSISQERTRDAFIEGQVGGEVYEVRDDGERFVWGKVLVWESPQRFVLAWHPGLPAEQAQELEIRFIPDGEGTRVELEHRVWAQLGDQAKQRRANYSSGWDTVLGQHYAGACKD